MTYQILFYDTGSFHAKYFHLEEEFVPYYQPFGGTNIDRPMTREYPAVDCKINFQSTEILFGEQQENGLFNLTQRVKIKKMIGHSDEALIKYHLETYYKSKIKEVRELCHRPN